MATANPLAEKQAVDRSRRTEQRRRSSHAGFAPIATVFQGVLVAAHFFIYETWLTLSGTVSPQIRAGVAVGTTALCFSFLAASLLAFRYNNAPLRTFYRVAAVWLGTVNFLVIASVASWLAYGFVTASDLSVSSRSIFAVFFGAAAAFSVWGLFNAGWLR